MLVAACVVRPRASRATKVTGTGPCTNGGSIGGSVVLVANSPRETWGTGID